MRAPMRIFIFVYRHCLFKKESKYDPTGQLMDRILNALCIACEPKTQANATDSLPDKPKISAQLGYIHDTDCKEGAFVEMVDLKTNPDHSTIQSRRQYLSKLAIQINYFPSILCHHLRTTVNASTKLTKY